MSIPWFTAAALMAPESVDSSTIKKAAVEHGMLTLIQHGAFKVAQGVTTAAEVLSVTAEDVH